MAAPPTPRITIDRVSKEVELPKQSMLARADKLVILRDLSLEIDPGDFIVIIGPNGTGKSTLLNLIAGLDKPSSGQIWIDQRNLTQMSPLELAEYRNQTLGFITQKPSAITSFSLAENVWLPLLFNSKLTPPEREAIYEHAITTFKLEALMGRYPEAQLSGGQDQHMNMARALINDPAVILADEPTSGVDSQYSKLFFRLLRERHQLGRTIVLVTHASDWQAYFITSQIRLLAATGNGTLVEVHNRQKEALLEQQRQAAHAAPATTAATHAGRDATAARSRQVMQPALPMQAAASRPQRAAPPVRSAPMLIEQQADNLLRHCEDLLRAIDREESATVQHSLIREFSHSYKLLGQTMEALEALYSEGGATPYQRLDQRYRSLCQIVRDRSS